MDDRYQNRVWVSKLTDGVLISMSHDKAKKLTQLVGGLPADEITVDLYDELHRLGYDHP